MKTFMVEVEITVKRYVVVNARKPNGAIERLSTDEGWTEANRYGDETDIAVYERPSYGNIKFISAKEV